MTAFAVVDDVQAVWPSPLSAALLAVVAVQLDYAALLIRHERPNVDAWVTAGTLDPDIPKFVSVQMVRNFLLNTEGRKSGTKSIDDYTESWTLADAVAAGGMDLTETLLALLHPTTQQPRGAFTIRFIAPPRLRC